MAPMTAPVHTIGDLIRHHAAERPDKPAIILGDNTRTYGDLHTESSKVAQAMAGAGVENQDRVAFLDKNVPEYFTMLFGAAKLNACLLYTSPSPRDGLLSRMPSSA